MSDFTSNFWSIYIAAVTLAGIFGCLLLLWVTTRVKVSSDADNTTGHVWDEDLREMNNPLPRWWMWLFILTIVFSLGYLAVYPGLGSYAGAFNWSSTGTEYAAEKQKNEQAWQPVYDRFTGMTPEQLASDSQAMGIGERLFMNNCAQCHGSDAKGGDGFPNLTDNDWLSGGSPENIKATILKGRGPGAIGGVMAPIAAGVGTPEDVKNVANYVLSLSGAPHDPIAAQLGQSKFLVCAACHGMDAKGNYVLGAPNLTDDIWLHQVASVDGIVDMINNGKVNVMPAHSGKLTDAQVNVLAAYVWGKSATPAQ